MALTGPDCSKAVYGQVTMAFPGGNTIEEAPEPIAAALALVAANPPGGAAVAVRIRVLDGDGISLECCPDGFNWDGAARHCYLAPPPPKVINPPPSPPPPPPPPTTDGDDDELGAGFGQLLIQLQILINLIQQLTAGQPRPIDYSKCCSQIVIQFRALVKVVQQIEVKLSQPGAPPPPPIDLSGVLAELTCICQSSSSSATATASIAQNLPPSLKAIADAVAKGTDVSQIVAQLKKANELQDVPHAIIQQIIADKVIPKQYSGLLQGTPDSWVKTVLGIIGVVVPVVGIIENLTGNEDTFEAGKRAVNEATKTVVASLIRNTKAASGLKDTNTARDLHDAFAKWVSKSDDVLAPVVTPFVDTIVEQLKPRIGTTVTVGNIGVDPDDALATAVGIAFTSIVAAWVLSFLGVDEGESLTHMAEMFGGLVGFEELRDVKIGPLIEEGIGKVARANAKSIFRQDLPNSSELWSFVARGLFDRTRALALMPRTGLPRELENAAEQAAETGLQPFILLRLAGTGLFTDRDLVDEMTFRGVRPASQHRILLAAPYVATQKERDALRGTLEKGYAQGFFADADFTDRINQIEQITDRPTLIMDKVRLERAFAGAKDLEAAYETEFLAGITDVPQYQSKLAGLGLQPDYVAYLMAKAEAHANARLVRQAAAAERALAKATAAEERRAALTQYQAGTLNEAGLVAALVATGLTPIQAAAWVAQALGQRAGKLRLVYGLRLSPAEATLLRQRVADLTKQRELQMLTDSQFVQQLQALKIPPTFLNALRAGANAALKPKTAAILTPVTLV